jgi:aspartate/methionine/tyrosine aminotransferase
MYCT